MNSQNNFGSSSEGELLHEIDAILNTKKQNLFEDSKERRTKKKNKIKIKKLVKTHKQQLKEIENGLRDLQGLISKAFRVDLNRTDDSGKLMI